MYPLLEEAIPKIKEFIATSKSLITSAKNDFKGFTQKMKLAKTIENLNTLQKNLQSIANESEKTLKGLAEIINK